MVIINANTAVTKGPILQLIVLKDPWSPLHAFVVYTAFRYNYLGSTTSEKAKKKKKQQTNYRLNRDIYFGLKGDFDPD